MSTPEKQQATRRAWEKTGTMIAWDHSNPERTIMFEEAKKLQAVGSLFATHSNRRSKKGQVPRTLMVVAGAIDMANVAPEDELSE
jgi:hypothetical protein